jgi:ADP-glucose pyrophosphorylase
MQYYKNELGLISKEQEEIIIKEEKKFYEEAPVDYDAYIIQISIVEKSVGFLLSNGCKINFEEEFIIK